MSDPRRVIKKATSILAVRRESSGAEPRSAALVPGRASAVPSVPRESLGGEGGGGKRPPRLVPVAGSRARRRRESRPRPMGDGTASSKARRAVGSWASQRPVTQNANGQHSPSTVARRALDIAHLDSVRPSTTGLAVTICWRQHLRPRLFRLNFVSFLRFFCKIELISVS